MNETIKDKMLCSFVEVAPSDEKAIFIVDGIWYAPKWGCDSLQHFMELLRGGG